MESTTTETLPLELVQSHADGRGTDFSPPPSEMREIVYTPHSHLGNGLAAWREMVEELIASRELTWRLFLRDFSARYRQSILGYIWAIVPALVTTATFTWLNRAKVLPIAGTELPYPVFVLLGMTIWQLFANGLTGATQSLVNAGSLITKINFPRETLVLAAFGQSIFEFLIRMVLVAAAFVIFHVMPAWTVILIPLAMIPLCLFTLALGFIFSLLNGVMRDAGQIITFLLTFWMFLTPVVYPAPTHGAKSLINVLNPVSPFVIAAQDLTSRGHLTQPGNYAIGSAISLVAFLLAWRIFHLTETRIAERI
jgi:lipopolysaccharide transport system permease protein